MYHVMKWYYMHVYSLISHFVRVINITQVIIVMHACIVKMAWLFQPINGHLG